MLDIKVTLTFILSLYQKREVFSMNKKFFSYVLPSMLAFAFSGLYTLVDGFFIGRNVGDIGLASINIAFPLAALIQAIGTGLGMGGAIQISICQGKNKPKLEKKYFANTLVLLLIAGCIITLLLSLLYRPILSVLGAQDTILKSAIPYTRIIAIGTIFQLCATGFTPLLRNYNQSFLAMTAMISGFFTNILLDWLFVSIFRYGIAGAAWATIIGQGVTALLCFLFLLKKIVTLEATCYLWNSSIVLDIIKIGISPFGLTMSPFLVMIMINKWAVIYGGDTAVAAYAVVNYIASIILLLLQGISDGSQPLISLCLGKNLFNEAKSIRKLAYLFSALVAITTSGIILLLKDIIPDIFGAAKNTASLTTHSLPIFVSGFLFIAFCRVTTSYFYATKKNLFAYIMVYGEPILLTLLLITLFPRLMHLDGVWISAPVAQILLAIIGLILVLIEDKKYNKTANAKKI